MNKIVIFLGLLLLSFSGLTTEESKPILSEKESITEGQIVLQGQTIPYRTTAGVYSLKDDRGNIKAQFFYVAYIRTDVKDSSLRPLSFSFNGGPGASSVWMHMGFLGPKRVIVKNSPPYRYVDNPYSLLDVTDLVFIDPVSTGFSRAASGEDPKQFHSVDGDMKSIGEFIRLFVTRNNRWESPKYLIGASYGTMRAVKLANYLYEEFNMSLNGMILVSSVLDFQTIDTNDYNNDLSSILFLPSYTATAWNHQKLEPSLQKNFHETLKIVNDYAMNEYPLVLLKGDSLSPEQREEAVENLSLFTGLPAHLIDRANLRIQPSLFMKNLLAKENKILGRFDGRVTGGVIEADSERVGFDPSLDAVLSPFTAAFNQYVRDELKWVVDDEYKALTDVHPWSYDGANNRYMNVLPTLREVMIRMPAFKVFVASGYFDLATPFAGTEYTFNHLNIKPSVNDRITMKYYPGGHMMYIDPPSLESLSGDLHTFIKK